MSVPDPPSPRALTPMQRAQRDNALRAAERGWRVFPLVPGTKRPVFEQWERHATTDPTRITSFWTRRPGCNIAVACGPSRLLVIDLDLPKAGHPEGRSLSIGGTRTGAQVLDQLAERTGGELPATYTVRTPSGGTHLYYRAPTAPRLGCSQAKLGPLVDTRGHGGYVVAPSSITPQGGYELIDDREPAELPGWIALALAPRPSPAISAAPDVAPGRLDAYVAAAVRSQVERVRAAPPGRHNHTLFVAACRLGELVGAGALDPGTATHMLQHAAEPIVVSDCDCTKREVTNTIASGLRTGAERPRRLPPRHRRAA